MQNELRGLNTVEDKDANGPASWCAGAEALSLPKRPAIQVVASREVTIRYRGQALQCAPIKEPRDAVRLASKVVRDDAKEQVIAVYLDGRHRPLGHATVSVGTATASLVHPREVFQTAVLLGAVSIIVLHNHPSGDPTPSAEDYEVTGRLAQAGKLLGVRLLGSVVFTREMRHRSIREEKPDAFE